MPFTMSTIAHSRSLAFWRDWSPGVQTRTAQAFVVLACVAGCLIWFALFNATRQTAQQAQHAWERHQRAAGLVREIRALEGARGDTLSGAPILIAARQVSRDIGLEEKLTSVRPALQSAGRDGVQLYYERLNLPELIGLLEAMQREAGLKTSTMTLNRRLDDPALADLQLVLFR